MIDYKNADNELRDTYSNLAPVVKDIVAKHTKNIDEAMKKIKKDSAETMSNKELRNLILELQVEEFYFAPSKDLAVLRQECAVALERTAQAEIYNGTEGTQNYRTNKATANTVDKEVVRILYNAVANTMKTKLEETHRMIGVLNSILISRSAEAKLKGANGDDDTRNNID